MKVTVLCDNPVFPKLRNCLHQILRVLLSLPAIVNRDGTRYSQTGEYRTNPEDIFPSNPTDDDVSSGSSSERSTSGGYIFHTHLPTAYPTQDQGSPGVSNNPENTAITSKENESLWLSGGNLFAEMSLTFLRDGPSLVC